MQVMRYHRLLKNTVQLYHLGVKEKATRAMSAVTTKGPNPIPRGCWFTPGQHTEYDPTTPGVRKVSAAAGY